jgi:predicted DNA-binding transcriptional regulator AlpA
MELLPPAEPLWSVREASRWLSITELSLRTMLKRRQFPPDVVLKLGRRVRFRSDLLRAWAIGQRAA